MSRYTVDLSRARTYSRRRRAQKAMSILREELEKREGEKVSISPEVNRKIWRRGAEKPPTSIEIEVTESAGEPVAVLPGSEPGEPQQSAEAEEEEEKAEKEPGEEESTSDPDADYDDIVSGTVADAKEAIRELDDPDYEALLEAEEEGKDRKTLKEWLESRK